MHIVVVTFGILIIMACLWGFFRGFWNRPRKPSPEVGSAFDATVGGSGERGYQTGHSDHGVGHGNHDGGGHGAGDN